jgi:hypothetical protein
MHVVVIYLIESLFNWTFQPKLWSRAYVASSTHEAWHIVGHVNNVEAHGDNCRLFTHWCTKSVLPSRFSWCVCYNPHTNVLRLFMNAFHRVLLSDAVVVFNVLWPIIFRLHIANVRIILFPLSSLKAITVDKFGRRMAVLVFKVNTCSSSFTGRKTRDEQR